MVFTKAGLVNEAEIEAGVRKVEKEFAPDVVRIGYSFDDDWMGEPSVFFRVLVTDEVAVPIERLGALSHSVSQALRDEARTFENGLYSYFSYRTVSEQQKLGDPAWK
jgi:hypothetical protein